MGLDPISSRFVIMTIKRTALSALHGSGLLGALRHARQDSTLVLTYHGVLPGDDDRYDFLNANFVSEEAFERQMRWLSSRYRLVSLRQIAAALNGGAPLPPRAATVTFDDGFANNFHVAFPILQRLSVPCAVFLTTGMIGVAGAQLWTERVKRAIALTPVRSFVFGSDGKSYLAGRTVERERAARDILAMLKRAAPGERDRQVSALESICGRPDITASESIRYDFLNWNQVRTMAEGGIEFGSHSVSHPILSTLSSTALESELGDSKRRIEAELGTECYSFAYPNGKAADFGEREITLLRGLGYRCALSLNGGLNKPDANPFRLERVNISREFDAALFNATLTGATGELRRMKRHNALLRPVESQRQ
jgi:peptidoglycan/xylan/chitin deacetylase (PgdA/CDA1 family)